MLFSQPKLVLDALRQVQQDHPYAVDGEIVESPRANADADALWERLLSLERGELDAVLSGLTGHEVRVALFGARTRMDDPRCLAVLARLFSLRNPESAGSLAWDGWLLSGDPGFREAASAYVQEHPARTLWPRLLRSASPLTEAIRALEQGKVRFDRWISLPEVGLEDRPLVTTRLRRLLLQQEHVAATSQREPHAAIIQWVNSLMPADEREAWYRDYLCTTYKNNWPKGSAVLEAIIDRFGRPESERPFWSTIPADVRREVTAWVNGGIITQLLKGRRAEFWLRFRYDIVRLEESRSRDAVFVGFDSWFAVQYKEMGRATYMFRIDQWNRLRWMDEPGLYKEILERYHEGRYLGRYEHRADDWESGAQDEVMRVMKLQKRSK